MEILDEVANDLKINKEDLARDSLKFFISKELSDTEAEMFKIAIRHGIKSVLEFDELLKAGRIKEEDIMDDYMELDYLEARREDLIRAIEKIK